MPNGSKCLILNIIPLRVGFIPAVINQNQPHSNYDRKIVNDKCKVEIGTAFIKLSFRLIITWMLLFLAHRTRSVKWAILITWCSSSVDVYKSVLLSFMKQHFFLELLLFYIKTVRKSKMINMPKSIIEST